MENAQEFVDYYNILQVNPQCDAQMLESAYRILVKKYHPDHSQNADVGKFTELTEAYGVLRDPDKRADYDRSYFARTGRAFDPSPLDQAFRVDEKTAVRDADVHESILLHLYKRRREHAQDAGVLAWFLQEKLNCSDENFDFHVWYLKSKGLVETTGDGTLVITIQGVDHVISMCRTSVAEKLLLAQLDSSQDEDRERGER